MLVINPLYDWAFKYLLDGLGIKGSCHPARP